MRNASFSCLVGENSEKKENIIILNDLLTNKGVGIVIVAHYDPREDLSSSFREDASWKGQTLLCLKGISLLPW